MTEENAIVLATPKQIVKRQTEIIDTVREIVREHHVVTISGRKYVDVAGLTMMATVAGCTVASGEPVRVEVADGVWAWKVEARVIRDGVTVSTGWGLVGDDEGTWKNRPHFAKAAMAATRAAGRAMRMLFSPMVVAMGYQATPAEEMPSDDEPQSAPKQAAPKPATKTETKEPSAKSEPRPVPEEFSPWKIAKQPAGDVIEVAGVVEAMNEKATSTGGTKFGIKFAPQGGEPIWLNTFDAKAVDAIRAAGKGTWLSVAYVTGRYGNDVTSIDRAVIDGVVEDAPF